MEAKKKHPSGFTSEGQKSIGTANSKIKMSDLFPTSGGAVGVTEKAQPAEDTPSMMATESDSLDGMMQKALTVTSGLWILLNGLGARAEPHPTRGEQRVDGEVPECI